MLFRKDRNSEEELPSAEKYFEVFQSRAHLPDNSLVIGRYSCLPYYKELVEDLACHGSQLINSLEEHIWIANFDYYHDLREFTPESWEDYNIYLAPEGEFVVKGRTNSKKHRWNTLMYAPSKREAILIASKLMDDMCICEQGIIYRRYVPLRTFEIGINDLPFTNEWRLFYLGTKRIAHGYYWSIAEDTQKIISEEALAFADQVALIAAEHATFFVLDIAEKKDGGWILIEVNDGQQSGLSEIEPEEFYRNLAACLKERDDASI